MSKIPTAEEFARGEYDDFREDHIFMERQIDMKHALWMMNVHAKRHVKAVLEAAIEKAVVSYTPFDNGSDEGGTQVGINKDSIINSYPLNQIL